MNQMDQRAKEILQALDLWRLPVSPLSIMEEEGIKSAPGKYGEEFDARIEFLPEINRFVIFFKESRWGPTEGRVRFSLAHELGHYYLHQERLLRGEFHDSVSDFRSPDAIEQEADEFAACLLMPDELFVAEVERHHRKVCTLSELCRLADRVFQTSVTSTVRRYCQCCVESCAMVISEKGRVKWALPSEDMRLLGMGWIKFGSPVPPPSHTARLWADPSAGNVEGSVDSSVWYDRPQRPELWEEAMALGRTGLVLTFLAVS